MSVKLLQGRKERSGVGVSRLKKLVFPFPLMATMILVAGCGPHAAKTINLSTLQRQTNVTIVIPSKLPRGVAIGGAHVNRISPDQQVTLSFVNSSGRLEFDLEESKAGGMSLGGPLSPLKFDGISANTQTIDGGKTLLMIWTSGHDTFLLSDYRHALSLSQAEALAASCH